MTIQDVVWDFTSIYKLMNVHPAQQERSVMVEILRHVLLVQKEKQPMDHKPGVGNPVVEVGYLIFKTLHSLGSLKNLGFCWILKHDCQSLMY